MKMLGEEKDSESISSKTLTTSHASVQFHSPLLSRYGRDGIKEDDQKETQDGSAERFRDGRKRLEQRVLKQGILSGRSLPSWSVGGGMSATNTTVGTVFYSSEKQSDTARECLGSPVTPATRRGMVEEGRRGHDAIASIGVDESGIRQGNQPSTTKQNIGSRFSQRLSEMKQAQGRLMRGSDTRNDHTISRVRTPGSHHGRHSFGGVGRMYAMKIQADRQIRHNQQSHSHGIEPPQASMGGDIESSVVAGEDDVASVTGGERALSIADTESVRSSASTKVLTQPLPASRWKPMQQGRSGVKSSKAKGVGMLTVDHGTTDGEAPRDTAENSSFSTDVMEQQRMPRIVSRLLKKASKSSKKWQVGGELPPMASSAKQLRRQLHQALPIEVVNTVGRDEGEESLMRASNMKPGRLTHEDRAVMLTQLEGLNNEGTQTLAAISVCREESSEHFPVEFPPRYHVEVPPSPPVSERLERLKVLSRKANSILEQK